MWYHKALARIVDQEQFTVYLAICFVTDSVTQSAQSVVRSGADRRGHVSVVTQ